MSSQTPFVVILVALLLAAAVLSAQTPPTSRPAGGQKEPAKAGADDEKSHVNPLDDGP